MYDVCYSERHCHVYKASFKPEVFRVYSVCLRAEGLFGDLTKLLRGGPVREEEDRTEKGMDTKRRWSLKSRHVPVGETQKEAFDSGRGELRGTSRENHGYIVICVLLKQII